MPEAATETKRRPPTWGQPVPDAEARALRSHTLALRAVEDVELERAETMFGLHRAGYSFDAIAAAAGVTREAVRKSVLRWEKRTGA